MRRQIIFLVMQITNGERQDLHCLPPLYLASQSVYETASTALAILQSKHDGAKHFI
jgi:hypothetical protein